MFNKGKFENQNKAPNAQLRYPVNVPPVQMEDMVEPQKDLTNEEKQVLIDKRKARFGPVDNTPAAPASTTTQTQSQGFNKPKPSVGPMVGGKKTA